MDWLYAGLIIGCLAYAGAIVIEYANYRTAISPRISDSEEVAAGVGLEFAEEERAAEDLRARIHRLQADVDELRRQKTSLQGRLVTEKERKQRLEIAVFRKRLKSRQSLVSA